MLSKDCGHFVKVFNGPRQMRKIGGAIVLVKLSIQFKALPIITGLWYTTLQNVWLK